jgi:hypothetical protein
LKGGWNLAHEWTVKAQEWRGEKTPHTRTRQKGT